MNIEMSLKEMEEKLVKVQLSKKNVISLISMVKKTEDTRRIGTIIRIAIYSNTLVQLGIAEAMLIAKINDVKIQNDVKFYSFTYTN